MLVTVNSVVLVMVSLLSSRAYSTNRSGSSTLVLNVRKNSKKHFLILSSSTLMATTIPGLSMSVIQIMIRWIKI